MRSYLRIITFCIATILLLQTSGLNHVRHCCGVDQYVIFETSLAAYQQCETQGACHCHDHSCSEEDQYKITSHHHTQGCLQVDYLQERVETTRLHSIVLDHLDFPILYLMGYYLIVYDPGNLHHKPIPFRVLREFSGRKILALCQILRI